MMRILLILLISGTVGTVTGAPWSSVIDTAGNFRVNSLPDTESSVVTLVTSPGTPCAFTTTPGDEESLLSYDAGILLCHGATLQASTENVTPIATSSLVAGCIVLDGVVVGDLEAGLRESRHGKTLLTIFRARLDLGEKTDSKQTLILPIQGEKLPLSEAKITTDVMSLFAAVAFEKGIKQAFGNLYELKIVPYTEPTEIMTMAKAASEQRGKVSLPAALTSAFSTAKSLPSMEFDASPMVAEALVNVGSIHRKQSRTVRAKLASWKARVARGLLVNGFGNEAQNLLDSVLQTYDSETIAVVGMPLVAAYRSELRTKLKNVLEMGIRETFERQIENLEKTTLKRLNAQMLRTVNDPVETVMDANAASLRNAAFAFEAAADNLEVPSLGLTKVKVVRDMSGKLNDAVMKFPDSPAAKLKRTRKVSNVVKKDKKPGQGIVDLGLDLVAVLRPDGFGSLQGFAMYKLGGNSVTFGIHNDADDPQTIAQFGGVRPPLLRVQPQIRMDVEL